MSTYLDHAHQARVELASERASRAFARWEGANQAWNAAAAAVTDWWSPEHKAIREPLYRLLMSLGEAHDVEYRAYLAVRDERPQD